VRRLTGTPVARIVSDLIVAAPDVVAVGEVSLHPRGQDAGAGVPARGIGKAAKTIAGVARLR
jgi:hypothetical protein